MCHHLSHEFRSLSRNWYPIYLSCRRVVLMPIPAQVLILRFGILIRASIKQARQCHCPTSQTSTLHHRHARGCLNILVLNKHMAQVRNTSGDRTSRFATPHHGRVESHIHDYGHPNQQPSRHVQGNNNNRNQEARKCVRPSTPRRGYNRSRSTFSQLDEDVLLHIISHLDVKDILTLRQVSTVIHFGLCNDRGATCVK